MEIRYYHRLPSTNDAASLAAREGAAEFYTVVAKEQSGGRGRLGRQFFSPAGGTYFSTVLRPTFPISMYGRITPFAAVAVHRALRPFADGRLEIKWVNDILLNRKKVCGILAESGVDAFGVPFVVLGIGINTGSADFPPALSQIAAVIPVADQKALIERILAELSDYDSAVRRASFVAEYRSNAAFLGETVRVIEGECSYLATALDITEDGALLVKLPDGSARELHGGEISLRTVQKDEI